MPYTITGAPRVFDGKVVVGNAGGDLGVRGFVSAYDAETGRKLWKFFLTPNPAGKPDGEASDAIMGMIQKTWSDGLWKQLGGGANPWDSIGYDPRLNMVYVGTGNGSPLSWHHRSGGTGRQSLHLLDRRARCEHRQIRVALSDGARARTGTIPAPSRSSPPISRSRGKMRQVLMQAPKNGFFYVIDRKTGQFISAEKIAPVNWASGIDPRTGRPHINPHYGTEPQLVMPGPGGAHNWFPMAYSPRTRLAYLPTYESGMVYAVDPDFKPKPFRSNSGWGGYTGEALRKRREIDAVAARMEKTFLTAWDPVDQKLAWRVQLPRHGNGGVMVTASDLVFEGTTRQTFAAFDARSGQVLWEMPVQSAPVGGAITYMLDGVQYVAVNAGWGGGAAQIERGAGIELPRASARLLRLQARRQRPAPADQGGGQGARAAPADGERSDRRARCNPLCPDLPGLPRPAGDRWRQGPARVDPRGARQVQRHRAGGHLQGEGHGQFR